MEPLDPRFISLQRLTGALFVGAVAVGMLLFLGFNIMIEDDWPDWLPVTLLAAWLILAMLGAWHAWRWPAVAYRHTSYRVDDEGIEIHKGVYWRVVINVPRSRVQHIDVSQGPLERRHELATLVVYTAGTDHAKVGLEGLEHGRALAIRQMLLPSGAIDAV